MLSFCLSWSSDLGIFPCKRLFATQVLMVTFILSHMSFYWCLCVRICVYLKALEALMRISEGDMRRAVMFLQSASRLCGQDDAISTKIIMEITGVSTVSVLC